MFTITVPSSDKTKAYTVRKVSQAVWTCDCPDHLYRANGEPYVCRHIAEVAASLGAFASTAKMSKKAQAALA